jgi:uncharacterized spore protein YtfJ
MRSGHTGRQCGVKRHAAVQAGAWIHPRGGVMQVEELISSARDVISVKRVYGDPYEKNGLTVIPAATVRGGGGGGMGESQVGESGGGGGFGMIARPSGAWMVENGEVTWKPAIDVNRVVLGGQIIALAAILVTGRVLMAHSRHRRSLAERIPRPRRRQHQVRLQIPRLAHR